MWVFSKVGFYSAVRTRDGKGIVVRARLREHLVALVELLDRKPRIAMTTDSDYRYRIVVDDVEWAGTVSQLALDIDYDNFKESVPQGPYEQALHAVWQTMHRLQK